MAEQNAYVTGVGEYPVAPDTSIEAFLQEYEGGYYNTPYRKRLLQSDEPSWGWESNDFYNMRAAYDSWVAQRTNKFNADVKQWEIKYKTPLNQSELLESAGYNRNWIQGAEGSQVEAGDPLPIRSAGGVDYNPADQLLNFMDSAVSLVDRFAAVKDSLAGSDLKNAQASQIRALTPMKEFLGTLRGTQDYMKLFGNEAGSSMGVLPLPSGNLIDFALPNNEDSIFYNLLKLQNTQYDLNNQRTRLSNSQLQKVNEIILPLQEEIYKKQTALLDGSITFQTFENEVRAAAQDYLVTHAKDFAVQKYISGWVDMGVDVIGALAPFITPFLGNSGKVGQVVKEIFDGNGEITGGSITTTK